MKTDAPPAAADGTPADGSARAAVPSDGIRSNPATPQKIQAALDERNLATPPKSAAPHRGGPTSSCKRRRLDSEDDENISDDATLVAGSSFDDRPRKLSYEKCESSDTSDESDDDDDSIGQEIAAMRQESILRKIRRLNYEDGEDQLLHTAAFAKLFEYVKDFDVVAETSVGRAVRISEEDGDDGKADEGGAWKYRGSGYVKFIKCLQEGYNCGMIRMELTKNGTIETLMCHELTYEEVLPMPAKKGKAYTWRVKDWAYRTATRTFAIRFDDDMGALSWKTQLEESKRNNQRVRKGEDVPDLDDVCSTFQNMSTAAASSSA